MHGHKNTCSFTIHPKLIFLMFFFLMANLLCKTKLQVRDHDVQKKKRLGGTQLCSIINLVSEIEKALT